MQNWEAILPKFVKVFPHEYKRVLGVPRIPAGMLAAQAGTHAPGHEVVISSWVKFVGKTTGFKEFTREMPVRRPVEERVNDYFEVYYLFPEEKVRTQAARCMDCGIPFCHTGCPVNNIIPDWNDLVYRDQWKEAIRVLHSTNNFPEFTGRICPAPCEAACVLGINEPPVTIKVIEKNIVERAWQEGWIQPEPPETRTGKRVAVVGSGPSGMAAAQQLNRAGHLVTLFEKNDRLGGLMRYGIPDFKMEKHVLDRRLVQMSDEGVRFETGAHIGGNVPAKDLQKEFDAILLCGGAEAPRDLNVPGRELKGIHFAMEFLPQQNKRNAGDDVPNQILATGKHVIIIGGGDTGADCLGTCHRHKAEVRAPVRDHAQAAGDACVEHALAAVAAANAFGELPRRGRIARMGHRNHAF